ncbi:FKBP-type peptidyl-prolyl cis-trans isomerase [Marinoscillum furvescens]|uniref:Peptidyl-prolyl cis-trans isomerase n=1 Tax=Marinoscillum furvescens DSM 4134 TaxID=1122208 RepID=A0A3D9KZT5_MARFU|nr:FKBP-type peptidyl-prolyl cis-trans isomerase [Marinoscillum furvescens]RED94922.1 FKBP-type peptidyl-prolyl isomerase-like protein [Marinoscillum furvescens DSM 4134]
MRKGLGMIALMASVIWMSGCLKTEDVFDPADQFNKEQALIDQYIVEQGLTVQTDTQGYELRYSLVDPGNGPAPENGQYVFADYVGKLIPEGNVFHEADSIYVQLGGSTIAGWQLLMPYARENGKIIMLLPSYYAFGQSGSADGNVPGNTPVAYEVNVRGVYDQFGFEQKRIQDYLTAKNLTAEMDSTTGLRYIITEEGTGRHPTVDDTVRVDYEGRFLVNDEVFEGVSGVKFKLDDLIEGWGILMPYVKEGGSITMFIPSKYAYGSGSSQIPPNATMIFEVTLTEIVGR